MHKNIRLLTWFTFFQGFSLYSAIGIIYFVHVTGSYALGLLVYSVASISSVIFEVPTGILSDNIGRKKTIIWGAVFNVFAIVCYAIGQSFLILAIGSVFLGLASSLFSGNNAALLFDSIREIGKTDKYSEYSGKINSMTQFAPTIAGLIGGFLAQWSFTYLMWLSVLPQLLCLIVTFFMIEPKVVYEKESGNIFKNLREALRRFKQNYQLRTLSLTSIIEHGVGETMYKFTPAFIGSLWPLWAVGVARALNNFFGAVGYRIAGKVLAKFPTARTMLFGEMTSSTVGLIAVIFPTVLSPILYALTSVFYGINNVARETLMQLEFSDEQRATMGSLNALFGNIFFAVFSFLFGLIADTISVSHTLLIGEIALLPIIYLYWKLLRNNKVKQSEPVC